MKNWIESICGKELKRRSFSNTGINYILKQSSFKQSSFKYCGCVDASRSLVQREKCTSIRSLGSFDTFVGINICPCEPSTPIKLWSKTSRKIGEDPTNPSADRSRVLVSSTFPVNLKPFVAFIASRNAKSFINRDFNSCWARSYREIVALLTVLRVGDARFEHFVLINPTHNSQALWYFLNNGALTVS